jgi:hypothetical protein
MPIITKKKDAYNQSFSGVFGEFGQGGGAQIFFVQTAISPRDLDKIQLVGDIEGSEKWEVRDLFQRDVDIERVSGSLVPYLLDENSIKFFNPLTLTFIPPVAEHDSFAGHIPVMDPYSETIDDYAYSCVENPGFYRFRYIDKHTENGIVEWNDSETKLVAIDGQHRLQALKDILNDPNGRAKIDFDSWRIPVVIFGVRSIDDRITENQRTLDVIRRTFVYINTEAKAPSQTRQILLNDSLANEIGTQEFVNYFHANDSKPKPDLNILPLLIFNWRGAHKDSRTDHMPGTLKTIEEIRDWLQYYILGENWSAEQQELLGIEVTGDTKDLKIGFRDKSLKPSSVKLLRELFRTKILPGLAHLMQEFTPISDYGKALREIEDRYNSDSHEARHAFHKFRFGNSTAHGTVKPKIDAIETHITEDIVSAVSFIPDILQKDIGMRGVVFAYGNLYRSLGAKLAFDDLYDYSVWFTKTLNQVYSDGWFGPFGGTLKHPDSKTLKSFLHQIAYSHDDRIINYRLEHSKAGLGGLLSMVISAKGLSDGVIEEQDFKGFYGEFRDRISATLLSGFKKQVRQKVVEKMPTSATVKQVNSAVKEEAERLTQIQLSSLDNFLLGDGVE